MEAVRDASDALEVADEDLYPRLKALQRQLEFLGIQVRDGALETEHTQSREGILLVWRGQLPWKDHPTECSSHHYKDPL